MHLQNSFQGYWSNFDFCSSFKRTWNLANLGSKICFRICRKELTRNLHWICVGVSNLILLLTSWTCFQADKGPVLTAARDCRFEVFWETEFACPEAKIMSTNNCTLVNKFVNFDLTKLSADSLENYKLGYDVTEKGKKTHYIIYMNVCKPLGFPCGGRGLFSFPCWKSLSSINLIFKAE